MSGIEMSNESATETPTAVVDMKLEVVAAPVSDVDQAKRFYETLGFQLDIDHVGGEDFRVVQFTPPGSECSIIIGSDPDGNSRPQEVKTRAPGR
jgi:catechol 2,3-dioxygenase-like lactoylglutathione lyase family enzyme